MLHEAFYSMAGVVIVCTLSLNVQAWDSSLHVGGLIGYGESAVKINNQSQDEAPMAFSLFVDYGVNSHFSIGAEHVRGLDPTVFASGVSLTGVDLKWYFSQPMPHDLPQTEEISETQYFQRAISPYLGVGLGFAQSSLPSATAGQPGLDAVGGYVSLKFGLGYPLMGRWNLRGEGSYGTTLMGTGQIQILHFLAGVCYSL